MLGHRSSFFVLPDSPDAHAVAERATGPDVVRHPSGRPWIIGRWQPGELRVGTAGRNTIVLIGLTDLAEDRLAAMAARLRDVRSLTELIRAVPGSYHTVASVDGEIRFQGTAYGTRRIYHTTVDGIVVASDRAAALAELTGAPVDMGALATRLMLPQPYPLGSRPMWTGLHAVQAGDYLAVSDEGRALEHREWHRPPTPDVPLAAGAKRVRETLTRAVALRTTGGGPISADMSGGLDSTSVAFLAAQHLSPGDLTVCTGADHAPTNDDVRWARIAARSLSGVEHDVFDGKDYPLFYDGVLDDRDRFDQPTEIVVTRRRMFAANHRMAARGSRLHLTGVGGDHLFLGVPAHYHGQMRTSPSLALQRIRGYRALFSWRWRDIARALADRQSFTQAMAGMDVRNTKAIEVSTVRMGWFTPPRMPAWLTEECYDLIDAELNSALAADPLDTDRGRHTELEAIDKTTRDMTAWNDVATHAGVPMGIPYFDDHVIDAALSVRVADRTTPFAYKRLLAEAMRGVLPPELLRRRTKAVGGAANHGGLRRHREELAGIWAESALGKAGLIDAEQLRTICASPESRDLADNGLCTTLAAEAWLRTAAPVPSERRIQR